MKSISLLMTLMILLTAFSLSAQTTVGITAGASFANVTIKLRDISVSPKSKTGITAGSFHRCPIKCRISVFNLH